MKELLTIFIHTRLQPGATSNGMQRTVLTVCQLAPFKHVATETVEPVYYLIQLAYTRLKPGVNEIKLSSASKRFTRHFFVVKMKNLTPNNLIILMTLAGD